MLNFKNLSENLIITVVVMVASTFAGYWISIKSAERMLDNQKSIIEEAIRQETTSITNEFKTEIKKLKVKKDGVVDLVTTPEIHSEAATVRYQDADTVIADKKPGFFKRLFKRKNN